MNEKSDALGENRMIINISCRQLHIWFVNNNRKEFYPKEKPLDTPHHNMMRLQWVREYHHKITNLYIPVAYLDENWFCTTNRTRKIKRLPRGTLEELGTHVVVQPKIRSRCYPVKSMFIGAVVHLYVHRRFDGRILLEKVIVQQVVSKSM